MALQAKSAHGNQICETLILFAALHQVPASSKLRVSSGKFGHLCAAHGMVYSASEYLPNACSSGPNQYTREPPLLKGAYDHSPRGAFAVAEGRCWIAIRINSGSVRTPSLALSCVQVLATVL